MIPEAPEVWRTTFEHSANGTDWARLGAGTRIGGGWQLTTVAAPSSETLRARGYVAGGNEGSVWFVESTLFVEGQTPVTILVNDGTFGFASNQFGFSLSGSAGQVLVIEGSTNLVNWLPLATNVLGTGPFYFSDPESPALQQRFYRARLQ